MENNNSHFPDPDSLEWDDYWACVRAALNKPSEASVPVPIRGDAHAQGRPRRHRITRRHPSSSVEQSVYFIQASTGQIKIGAAHHPEYRLGQLQIAHPEPLTLLGTCAGGAPLEETLHREFTADWIRGEWFRASDRLMARIDALLRGPVAA